MEFEPEERFSDAPGCETRHHPRELPEQKKTSRCPGRRGGWRRSPKVLTETQREKITKQLASLNEIQKKVAVFTQELEKDAEFIEWIGDKASTITIRIIVITMRGSEPGL